MSAMKIKKRIIANKRKLIISSILIICIHMAYNELFNGYKKLLFTEFNSEEKTVVLSDELKSKLLDQVYQNSNRIDVTDDELYTLAEKSSNLALRYWQQWKDYPKQNGWNRTKMAVCDSEIPWISEFKFNNIYWQTVSNESIVKYFLFNAYYDNRSDQKFVQIIATQRSHIKSNLWCILYFENKRNALIVKAEQFLKYHKLADYSFLFISCPIPVEVKNLIPRAVSLNNNEKCPGTIQNFMRVIYEKADNSTGKIAICHKALRFTKIDLSLRFIEWIELQKIYGADQVYIYSLGSHPNMVKTLDYYQEMNFVDWKHITLPGDQQNFPILYQKYADVLRPKFWHNEILNYYDCYYRNIHKYEFIGILDMDEILVPVQQKNWLDMFRHIEKQGSFKRKREKVSTLFFTGIRVFSDIEDKSQDIKNYTYSLKHQYRGKFKGKSESYKSFHLTKKVRLFNHHINEGCIDQDKCSEYYVPTHIGYFLHTRPGWKVKDECVPGKKRSECILHDPILLKYKMILEENMARAIKNIYYNSL